MFTFRFSAVGCLPPASVRSEEHTSELQSRVDLVCRLLLEKKKTYESGQRGPQNQRFDTILKTGTVINQDEERVRYISSRQERIVDNGAMGQACDTSTIDYT